MAEISKLQLNNLLYKGKETEFISMALVGVILAIITWYILTKMSTILVIPKKQKNKKNKKSCDFY
jgi:hypothetical protein